MNEHLLLISIGPVQEFIAQARRTRDLWFGSHLLSELSRAVARRLLSQPQPRPEHKAEVPKAEVPIRASLIFPALAPDDPELDACEGLLRPKTGRPPLAIPNKILATLPADIDPRWAAMEARQAAQRRWAQMAQRVQIECAGLLAEGIDAAWEEQITTFLEFQAAWQALLPDRYQETRNELEEALASRKCLRDFPSWSRQRGEVPKSSLDGARETVLAEPARRDERQVRRYHISANEQLDAVGLVKRAGGDPGQFIPITNIALAPWIVRASDRFEAEIERLRAACLELGIGGIERHEFPWVRAFPFEAQVFLRSRWRPLFRELRGLDAGTAGGADSQARRLREESDRDAEEWGRRFVRPLYLGARGMPEPVPYVACLAADGDRIGKVLDRFETRQQHEAFSLGLSAFPRRVRQIVEEHHRGVLLYAGGDDVLAILCVEDALRCASELRRAFDEVMDDTSSTLAWPQKMLRPTLSVGVGIGHILDSLGHLRSLANRAEQLAKKERDALALILDRRSGGELRWRQPWKKDPVTRLQEDMAALEHRLPAKKVYEVVSDVRRTPEPDDLMDAEQRDWAELLQADVTRTLLRADGGVGLTPQEAGLAFAPRETYKQRRDAILGWGDRMLLARFLAEARRAASPGSRGH